MEFRQFLENLKKRPVDEPDQLAEKIDAEVWKEIDCLSCANCCKSMSPTFTVVDVKRIATHLRMSPKAFKDKWLDFNAKDGDWSNKQRPCQFLNLDTHKCDIYEVRPVDCAGFPHLTKKKMVAYVHVHQQNIEYCPATFRMVEKMKERLDTEL